MVYVRVMRGVIHRLVNLLSGTRKMLEKARFCKVDAGARVFIHEKNGCLAPLRPSWCIDRDHKKEVVSARAMREVMHRLVFFFSGTRTKMLEKALL